MVDESVDEPKSLNHEKTGEAFNENARDYYCLEFLKKVPGDKEVDIDEESAKLATEFPKWKEPQIKQLEETKPMGWEISVDVLKKLNSPALVDFAGRKANKLQQDANNQVLGGGLESSLLAEKGQWEVRQKIAEAAARMQSEISPTTK